MRVISEGCVFGETSFVLGISLQMTLAQASVENVILLEISRHAVLELLDNDAEMRARLYFILCQVCNSFVQCKVKIKIFIWECPN